MRNIIVFGHDPRMESVAGYFYHLGYDVYENPEEPVADACVITAPKLSEAEEEILCAYMTDDQILYHGLTSHLEYGFGGLFEIVGSRRILCRNIRVIIF